MDHFGAALLLKGAGPLTNRRIRTLRRSRASKLAKDGGDTRSVWNELGNFLWASEVLLLRNMSQKASQYAEYNAWISRYILDIHQYPKIMEHMFFGLVPQ